MQSVFKFCHLSQHCPLELAFPTSPTSIQDCTFHLRVMSLGDFKNINQILLFPIFKLPAALVLPHSSGYSHTSCPFLSQTQGRTLPSWSLSALPTADPSHLFISPQELPRAQCLQTHPWFSSLSLHSWLPSCYLTVCIYLVGLFAYQHLILWKNRVWLRVRTQ